MRFEDLNWMDVESYLKQDDRLMLVLGATEQHGYLSLLADARIPQAIADTASQQSGVLVAPALNFGISPHFTTYPGTLTLRVSTYVQVVEDLIRSAYVTGFRRVLVLNGHGGNTPATARMVELANELPELRLGWYAWWIAPNVTAVAEKHGLKSYHAAWIEAFPFTRVAPLPDGEKTPVAARPVASAREYRSMYGDGVFGGPYQVADAIMDEIMATCVKDVLELLRFEG